MSVARSVHIVDLDSSGSEEDENPSPQASTRAEQQQLRNLRNQIRQAEARVIAGESELQQNLEAHEAQGAKFNKLQTRHAKILERRADHEMEYKRWKKIKKVVTKVAAAKREYLDNTKFPTLRSNVEDVVGAVYKLRVGKALINGAKKPKPRGE